MEERRDKPSKNSATNTQEYYGYHNGENHSSDQQTRLASVQSTDTNVQDRISRVIKQIGATNGRDLASDIPKYMVPIDIIKGEEKLECYRQ
ncbi:hypothetical protein EIK77_004419 [Talaromyces pinophilus]|nr:hypothetical protein EIK77_004419 [Talaromyces pinophilus]